jgi:transposase InsO family protein
VVGRRRFGKKEGGYTLTRAPSFFHLMDNQQAWYIAKYIEYYNHKRIKTELKGMSPVQYRAHAQQAA